MSSADPSRSVRGSSKAATWAVVYLAALLAIGLMFVPLWRRHAALRTQLEEARSALAKRQAELADDASRLAAAKAAADAARARLGDALKELDPWTRQDLATQAAAAELGAAGKSIAGRIRLFRREEHEPYVSTLMNDPEYAHATKAVVREEVEARYGRLFAQLGLSPDQEDSLANLLADKLMTGMETASAGSGLTPAEVQAAAADQRGEINQQINQEFGVQVRKEISNFDGVSRFYQSTDVLAERLSYTDAPLQPEQEDQLVGLIHQSLGNKPGNSKWIIPDSAVQAAQSILSPAQQQAFVQLQAQQRTEATNSANAGRYVQPGL